MDDSNITAERLREVLFYDPETGVFKRIQNRSGPFNKAGTVAGSSDKAGRCRLMVDGKNYWAHRLAWLYMNGEWPKGHIDHIDCNPGNNAFKNLRDASRSINARNQRRAHKGTPSGLLGVSRNHGGWVAKISANGVKTYIGTYRTKEEAHAAYMAAKLIIHGI